MNSPIAAERKQIIDVVFQICNGRYYACIYYCKLSNFVQTYAVYLACFENESRNLPLILHYLLSLQSI